MGTKIHVSLFVTVVFGNIMEVLAANNDGTLHLGRDNDAGEDAAANGYVASEGAFLINVRALDGLLGGFKAKPDILVPTKILGLLDLGILENASLFLEGFFNLYK